MNIHPGNILFYQAIWILAQRTNFFVMACVSQTSLNVMANQIALMELMSWDVVSLPAWIPTLFQNHPQRYEKLGSY